VIGLRGVQYLIDALRQNQVIYLSFFLVLSLTFYVSYAFTKLKLNDKQISDEEAQRVANILQDNQVIVPILLSHLYLVHSMLHTDIQDNRPKM